jgi:hypothetical protein
LQPHLPLRPPDGRASAVVPAREVSVQFGVLLGRRRLGEGSLARQLAATAAIVAGIIAIAARLTRAGRGRGSEPAPSGGRMSRLRVVRCL